MGEIARGANGRRLFAPEFKKAQIGRVIHGEITQVELCQDLGCPLGGSRHRWYVIRGGWSSKVPGLQIGQ